MISDPVAELLAKKKTASQPPPASPPAFPPASGSTPDPVANLLVRGKSAGSSTQPQANASPGDPVANLLARKPQPNPIATGLQSVGNALNTVQDAANNAGLAVGKARDAIDPFTPIRQAIMSGTGRGLGSSLGFIGNALNTGLAGVEASVSDVLDPQQPAGGHAKLDQVGADFNAGGGWGNVGQALANISDNDVYFHKGSLDRVVADPKASDAQKNAAKFLLSHPWVSGTADFITQFWNPSNEAMSLGLRGVGAVAKATPLLGNAIEWGSRAMKKAFDKYNPLFEAGGPEAKKAAFLADSAKAQMEKANEERAKTVFGDPGKFNLGGTTTDEMNEITRRASGDPHQTPATSSGLTDEDLTFRALKFKELTDEADRVQLDHGFDVSMRENYFNMKNAYDLPETALSIVSGGKKPTRLSSALAGWRPSTDYKKTYPTFGAVLDAQAKGEIKLKSDFSPFGQLVAHLNRVSGNVAVDNLFKDLAETQAAAETAYTTKADSIMGPAGTHLVGKPALDIAKVEAARAARLMAARKAMMEVAQRYGIPEHQMAAVAKKRLPDADLLKAKLSESQRTANSATRSLKQVQSATNATTTKVGSYLLADINKQSAQLYKLNARIAKMQEYAHQGDIAARGKALVAAITQRDRIAKSIQALRDRVQAQAERNLGNQQIRVPNVDRAIPAPEPNAEGVFKLTPDSGKPPEGLSQIYGPVVGKISDIAKKLESAPSSTARNSALAALKKVADSAITAPERQGQTIETTGKKILADVQDAMSHVSVAGADNSSKSILASLQSVATDLEKQIGRKQADLYATRDVLTAPLRRLVGQAFLGQDASFKRGQDLADALADPDRPISKEYRALRDQYTADNMSEADPKSYWSHIRRHLTPDGYIQIKNIPGLSGLPRLAYTDAPKDTIRYFEKNHAPHQEANAVGQFLDRYNQLTRIGILTNPAIHPAFNLFWAYLADGGDLKRLIPNVLWKDSPLDHQAMKAGAHAPLAGLSFGGNPKRTVQSFLDATNEGLVAAFDWGATRLADINRMIVFETYERRMATELWDSHVANGMDKVEAAMRVRKAFGDYTNTTNIEKNLSRAFYFYPWTKTVIPFWLKTLRDDPKWVNAPQQGLQTHNELAGDPNVKKESYGTLYTGNDASGNPQYQALPLPQKRLEAPLQMAQGNLGKAMTEAQYHLTPITATAVKFGEQAVNQKPQEPDVSFGDPMYDRDAPKMQQVWQAMQWIGKNELPFSGILRGMAHGIGQAATGAPGRALENLIGGFQYSAPDPTKDRQLNRLFKQFQTHYDRAYGIVDKQARERQQAQLYYTFRQQVDSIISPARQQSIEPTNTSTPAPTDSAASAYPSSL